MHIDDWHDGFLSEFSPEVYVENLKTAHVTNAMIYLQSHAGLCYYSTKVGVMHRAYRGKELIHSSHGQGRGIFSRIQPKVSSAV